MSSEDKLPPELASFEARLRQQPLAASGVNRDQLMYEAGWAAATAARKTNWIWPTTSGALAASVLLLVSLLATRTQELPEGGFSEGKSGIVAKSASDSEPSLAPAVSVGGHAKTNRKNSPSQLLEKRPMLRWTINSPFLAMRERALRMEFDEPVIGIWDEDDQPTEATTARQLMQEFLGETS